MQEDVSDDSIEHDALIEMGHGNPTGAAFSQAFGGKLGGSPIPLLKQNQIMCIKYLQENLNDTDGCLLEVLHQRLDSDDVFLASNMDAPFVGLKSFLNNVCENTSLLFTLVKQADMLWGQRYGERPMFQKEGDAAKKGDPYTHEGVKALLEDLAKSL